MSKVELDRARKNFERLETGTAKRVLEFYDARRNSSAVASPSIVPSQPASSEALVS
jgi:hypothetical protein